MASLDSNLPNNGSVQTIDRAAVAPVSDDSFINEFVRSRLTADKDKNVLFYYGVVTNVIEESEEYDIHDIFYDIMSEQDRISDKNTNNTKKMVFVHIPSTTTNKITTLDLFNYNNFNKIRIVYNKEDSVQIGDIVTIEFQDKQNFLKPRIKEILKRDPSFSRTNEKISLRTYDKEQYTFLNIIPPDKVEQIEKKEITLPGGYYAQAIAGLNYIFSYISLFSFINGLDSSKYGDISKIKIILKQISIKQELYNYIKSLNLSLEIKIIPDDKVEKDYLIYGEVEITSENSQKNKEIKNMFFDFIKQRFNYVKFTFDGSINSNKFSLDVNLNNLNNTEKSLNSYLEIEKRGYLKNYIFENIPKNLEPQIINEGNFSAQIMNA